MSSTDTITVSVGFEGARAQSLAFEVADGIDRQFAFGAATLSVSSDRLDELRERDDVRYVQPVRAVDLITPVDTDSGDDTDPIDRDQCLPWGVDRVDADVATDAGYTGDGAGVAVIDTGVAPDHPDVPVADGKSFVEAEDPPEPAWADEQGHGTHVAGIITALDNDIGVQGGGPDIDIYAYKVFARDSTRAPEDAIAAAIEEAADNDDVDVINLSLGGDEPSELIGDAIKYACDQGTLVVAATGNDGCEGQDCVSYPAARCRVVAVTATNMLDQTAWFSNVGPEVNFTAPGMGVYSTVPGGYKKLSGTSMACPHASFSAAVVMNQGHSHAKAVTILAEDAEDLRKDPDEQGAGLVDLAAALGLDSSDDGTGDCQTADGEPRSLSAVTFRTIDDPERTAEDIIDTESLSEGPFTIDP